MGNCGNKIKHTCGGVQTFALCTKYEGTVSEHSSLTEDDCLDVQEVIEDIYDITEDIYSKIDVSMLVNDCIILTEPKTASSVIKQILDKLCALEDIVTSQAELIETLQEQVIELQENPCS